MAQKKNQRARASQKPPRPTKAAKTAKTAKTAKAASKRQTARALKHNFQSLMARAIPFLHTIATHLAECDHQKLAIREMLIHLYGHGFAHGAHHARMAYTDWESDALIPEPAQITSDMLRSFLVEIQFPACTRQERHTPKSALN